MVQTKKYQQFATAALGGDRQLYLMAAAASVVLSIWGAWAQYVPNPDAATYLRAAELIADGRWTAAVELYRWPTYSVAIAAVMTLTGVKALLAAQIVNAVFTVVTTVAFIALVSRLADGDRLVVLCAAIVILLQPNLTETRPTIVRDNGYFAFFVLSLYLVACDVASPSRATKAGIGAAIVAAGLFRIEGFLLAALVPIYYLVRQPGNWRRPSTILAIVAACLMLIPGVLLWNSGILSQWLTGRVDISGLASAWTGVANTIEARVHDLKYRFLYPYGGGNAWGAYVGITLGIVVVNVVRAVTVPLAILTAFAFFPRRVMPRAANAFVLWFAFAQAPMLLVFTFVTLLLDKRYAIGTALVLDIPLAFLIAEAIRQWRARSAQRFFLPVAAIVLVAVWAFNLPRPSEVGQFKEAGEWIGREIPSNARILTNDGRIAYFSGRPYDQNMRLWAPGGPAPTAAEFAEFDYFAFDMDASDLPAAIGKLPARQVMQTFAGKDGSTVIIYARQRDAAPSAGVAR